MQPIKSRYATFCNVIKSYDKTRYADARITIGGKITAAIAGLTGQRGLTSA